MNTPQPETNIKAQKADPTTRLLRLVVGGLVWLLVVVAAVIGVVYTSSPEPVRHPASAHFHFRLQMIIDGQAVNFGDAAYQTPFNKDICSAKLTNEPFHFHDGLDQFVHVHWAGLTGGLLLKNYGWDVVGGLPGMLGVRFDRAPRLTPVTVHGQALPAAVEGDQYYIYVGDAAGYQERSWNDFLNQDLEKFFAAKPATSSKLWDWLIPTAMAHDHEAELTRLNKVVGSAVIFAQRSKPTDAEVKDRFARLVALPQSSCGG